MRLNYQKDLDLPKSSIQRAKEVNCARQIVRIKPHISCKFVNPDNSEEIGLTHIISTKLTNKDSSEGMELVK